MADLVITLIGIALLGIAIVALIQWSNANAGDSNPTKDNGNDYDT
jgi:mannose/fructose/N-acetylgalactosamine-specific phosphotransferase system component IIC